MTEAVLLGLVCASLVGALTCFAVALLGTEEHHGTFLVGMTLLLLTGGLGVAGVAMFGAAA